MASLDCISRAIFFAAEFHVSCSGSMQLDSALDRDAAASSMTALSHPPGARKILHSLAQSIFLAGGIFHQKVISAVRGFTQEDAGERARVSSASITSRGALRPV